MKSTIRLEFSQDSLQNRTGSGCLEYLLLKSSNNSTYPILPASTLSRGSKAHHPATLLGILVYGYATGVFSSRPSTDSGAPRLERATYDSVAFRYIAANTHPDHDTLANFRRRFLDELAELFVQVLELAQEMKLLKLEVQLKVLH